MAKSMGPLSSATSSAMIEPMGVLGMTIVPVSESDQKRQNECY